MQPVTFHFDVWIKTAGKRKPRKAYVKPDLSYRKRYIEAYKKWQLATRGQKSIDEFGYFTEPVITAKTEHDKLEKRAEFYMTWIGGKAVQTPTKGTPLYRQVLQGGKLVKELRGYGKAKGGKGKMDTLIIYKGVTFMVDWKVNRDTQKDHQHEFQLGVESAGGIYLLLHSMNELYEVIDYIDAHRSLHGLKFYEK